MARSDSTRRISAPVSASSSSGSTPAAVGSCSTNSRSAYWDTSDDGVFVGNRHFRLANLIRASAAAPHYFDPELIAIAEGRPPGLFLDGAVTPHNNPSLALFLTAVLPAYGLNWTLGADKLRIISVGTGLHRPTLSIEEARRIRPIGLAVKALSSQISENEKLVLLLDVLVGPKRRRRGGSIPKSAMSAL